ncbi:MAG: hypothetical protein HFG33_01495 [Bacilli bacterium]|nr:hypothetical protein [Bacilli bacterium]
MEKLLDDYKERLKSTRGYDEDFAQTLSILADDLTEYYGEEYETLIYDTILSTEYTKADLKKGSIVYETAFDILDKKGLLDDTVDKKECDTEFRRNGTISVVKPKLQKTDDGYSVNGIERETVLPYYFNSENPASIGILARETMSHISSALGTYEVDGNSLMQRQGIRKTTYILKGEKKTVVEETGIGLEEGMLRYDELCFMRENYDSNYEPTGFSNTRIVAGFLSDNLGLRDIIKEARMTKDISTLKSVIDANTTNGYEDFMRQLDEMYRLERETLENVLDPEEFLVASNKRDEFYADIIASNVGQLEANIKKEEVITSGYRKS